MKLSRRYIDESDSDSDDFSDEDHFDTFQSASPSYAGAGRRTMAHIPPLTFRDLNPPQRWVDNLESIDTEEAAYEIRQEVGDDSANAQSINLDPLGYIPNTDPLFNSILQQRQSKQGLHKTMKKITPSANIDITSIHFNPIAFLVTVHLNTPYARLIDGLKRLQEACLGRSTKMKRLVTHHFGQFVHCKDTIDLIQKLLSPELPPENIRRDLLAYFAQSRLGWATGMLPTQPVSSGTSSTVKGPMTSVMRPSIIGPQSSSPPSHHSTTLHINTSPTAASRPVSVTRSGGAHSHVSSNYAPGLSRISPSHSSSLSLLHDPNESPSSNMLLVDREQRKAAIDVTSPYAYLYTTSKESIIHEESRTEKLQLVLATVEEKAHMIYAPLLRRRFETDRIRDTLATVRKYRLVLELPAKMRSYIQSGQIDRFVHAYKRSLLIRVGDHPNNQILRDTLDECRKICQDYSKTLLARLTDPRIDFHAQQRTMRLLLQLDSGVDPTWYYLEQQCAHMCLRLDAIYFQSTLRDSDFSPYGDTTGEQRQYDRETTDGEYLILDNDIFPSNDMQSTPRDNNPHASNSSFNNHITGTSTSGTSPPSTTPSFATQHQSGLASLSLHTTAAPKGGQGSTYSSSYPQPKSQRFTQSSSIKGKKITLNDAHNICTALFRSFTADFILLVQLAHNVSTGSLAASIGNDRLESSISSLKSRSFKRIQSLLHVLLWKFITYVSSLSSPTLDLTQVRGFARLSQETQKSQRAFDALDLALPQHSAYRQQQQLQQRKYASQVVPYDHPPSTPSSSSSSSPSSFSAAGSGLTTPRILTTPVSSTRQLGSQNAQQQQQQLRPNRRASFSLGSDSTASSAGYGNTVSLLNNSSSRDNNKTPGQMLARRSSIFGGLGVAGNDNGLGDMIPSTSFSAVDFSSMMTPTVELQTSSLPNASHLAAVNRNVVPLSPYHRASSSGDPYQRTPQMTSMTPNFSFNKTPIGSNGAGPSSPRNLALPMSSSASVSSASSASVFKAKPPKEQHIMSSRTLDDVYIRKIPYHRLQLAPPACVEPHHPLFQHELIPVTPFVHQTLSSLSQTILPLLTSPLIVTFPSLIDPLLSYFTLLYQQTLSNITAHSITQLLKLNERWIRPLNTTTLPLATTLPLHFHRILHVFLYNISTLPTKQLYIRSAAYLFTPRPFTLIADFTQMMLSFADKVHALTMNPPRERLKQRKQDGLHNRMDASILRDELSSLVHRLYQNYSSDGDINISDIVAFNAAIHSNQDDLELSDIVTPTHFPGYNRSILASLCNVIYVTQTLLPYGWREFAQLLSDIWPSEQILELSNTLQASHTNTTTQQQQTTTNPSSSSLLAGVLGMGINGITGFSKSIVSAINPFQFTQRYVRRRPNLNQDVNEDDPAGFMPHTGGNIPTPTSMSVNGPIPGSASGDGGDAGDSDTLFNGLSMALAQSLDNSYQHVSGVYLTLQTILASQYILNKTNQIHQLIHHSLNRGGINWRCAPNPTHVRQVMFDLLLTLVESKSEIDTFQNIDSTSILRSLVENTITTWCSSTRKIAVLSYAAAMQFKLETIFLQKSLAIYLTPFASHLIDQLLESLHHYIEETILTQSIQTSPAPRSSNQTTSGSSILTSSSSKVTNPRQQRSQGGIGTLKSQGSMSSQAKSDGIGTLKATSSLSGSATLSGGGLSFLNNPNLLDDDSFDDEDDDDDDDDEYYDDNDDLIDLIDLRLLSPEKAHEAMLERFTSSLTQVDLDRILDKALNLSSLMFSCLRVDPSVPASTARGAAARSNLHLQDASSSSRDRTAMHVIDDYLRYKNATVSTPSAGRTSSKKRSGRGNDPGEDLEYTTLPINLSLGQDPKYKEFYQQRHQKQDDYEADSQREMAKYALEKKYRGVDDFDKLTPKSLPRQSSMSSKADRGKKSSSLSLTGDKDLDALLNMQLSSSDDDDDSDSDNDDDDNTSDSDSGDEFGFGTQFKQSTAKSPSTRSKPSRFTIDQGGNSSDDDDDDDDAFGFGLTKRSTRPTKASGKPETKRRARFADDGSDDDNGSFGKNTFGSATSRDVSSRAGRSSRDSRPTPSAKQKSSSLAASKSPGGAGASKPGRNTSHGAGTVKLQIKKTKDGRLIDLNTGKEVDPKLLKKR